MRVYTPEEVSSQFAGRLEQYRAAFAALAEAESRPCACDYDEDVVFVRCPRCVVVRLLKNRLDIIRVG